MRSSARKARASRQTIGFIHEPTCAREYFAKDREQFISAGMVARKGGGRALLVARSQGWLVGGSDGE
jgi:hypothetical protein